MKEVIILGKAPSGRLCPFDAEVWGLNNVCIFPVYKDKHFNKLIITDPMQKGHIDQEWIDKVKSYGIPIIGNPEYADEMYPIEEITKAFLPPDAKDLYLRNTCVRAMALAMYRNYEKIRLYGIDQGTHAYLALKGCVEYWIGRAHERGIIVDTQKESYLMRIIQSFPIQYLPPIKK